MRQRALLSSANWKEATPEQVSRLRTRLTEAGVKMPPWLARDLLIAGHSVEAEPHASHDTELAILSSLNALPTGQPLAEPLRHALLAKTSGQTIDPEIAAGMCTRLLALGEPSLACRLALSQWPQAPAAYRVVRKPLQAEIAALPALRVSLAGFSTTDLFAQSLVPAFAAIGRRIDVENADFGSVVAALLDPAATADAMFILLDQDSLCPTDWRKDLQSGLDLVDRQLASLLDAIAAHAGQSSRPVFINTLAAVAAPTIGHVDSIHDAGASAIAARVNAGLARIAAQTSSVNLINADVAMRAIAPVRRTDAKNWYYGRIAYSDEATSALAKAFAVAWAARERGPVKVIAVDFDNTLWGGVFGDDGIANLACGDDFPGNAYNAFQRECLRLKAQGLLLVALSKNNADAITAFADHPGMSLKADDFVATAINWEPKPDNIARLASELNLGLDSFLFLDDSPHEREAMRLMRPQVQVPEMPGDPALRPMWLRMLTSTWPVRLTAEDTQRSQMYLADRKVKELRESAVSYDDYLKELEQKLTVEVLSPATLARVSQLHERTNQYNLTTRRFKEAELSAFSGSKDAVVLLGTVDDRFGDHGIVIAAVATCTGTTAQIESFLMSCRVIARQVETAFLATLMERLVERGIERIEACYRPTAKNEKVRDFYPSHGFAELEPQGNDRRFVWQKDQSDLPHTPFVAVQWKST